MTEGIAFETKGWCPGALRPMASGDGLIVRVRPRTGTLSLAALRTVASAAHRHGNGHVDLTRRANVQIRGVDERGLAPLLDVLASEGLVDGDPETEAIRNVAVSPLAGLDPSEALDVRPIARSLEQALAENEDLRALPPKFAFVIDGGGTLTLGPLDGDVRLVAHRHAGDTVVTLLLDGPEGPRPLGRTSPDRAAEMAVRAAHGVLSLKEAASRGRARDLSRQDFESLSTLLALAEVPQAGLPTPEETQQPRTGLLDLGGGSVVAGVGAPFGRIEAQTLTRLSDVLDALGVTEVRLSPWRVLYAPLSGRDPAEALLRAAAGLGLVTQPDDPLLRIDACPGAPACRAATVDTRGDARRIADLMRRLTLGGTVHVSGCAKGCARSRPASLTLVGEAPGRYRLIRDGTARDEGASIVSPAEIGERLVSLLSAQQGDAHA